jgi:hypothetical protein
MSLRGRPIRSIARDDEQGVRRIEAAGDADHGLR